MCVCVCVCVYLYIYILYICVCVCVCVCKHTHIHTYIHTYNTDRQTHIYIRTDTYIYVYVYIYIYIHIYVYNVCIETFGDPGWEASRGSSVVNSLEIFFTWIFAVELLLNLAANLFTNFIHNGWSMFDLIVVPITFAVYNF